MTEVTPGGPSYKWAKHWRSEDLKRHWTPRAFHPHVEVGPFPGNARTDPADGAVLALLEDQRRQFESRTREHHVMTVSWATFVVTWSRAYRAAFVSSPARSLGDLDERQEYARLSACRHWRCHLDHDHPCYWSSPLPSSMVYHRVLSPLEAPNVIPEMPPPPKAQKRPMTDEEKFQYQLRKKFEQERKKLEESR